MIIPGSQAIQSEKSWQSQICDSSRVAIPLVSLPANQTGCSGTLDSIEDPS